MKQLTCAEMEGPATCSVMLSGDTFDAWMTNAWKHLEEAHPEMAANIKNNPKEVNEKWQADFRAKWETLPEVKA